MTTTGERAPAGVRGLVLTVRFLAELGLLAALGVGGALLAGPLPLRLAVAVLVPLAVAVVWGVFLSPRARRPLDDPLALVVEVVLFAVGVTALAVTGHPVWAAVLAVAGVGGAVLLRALRLHHRQAVMGEPGEAA